MKQEHAFKDSDHISSTNTFNGPSSESPSVPIPTLTIKQQLTSSAPTISLYTSVVRMTLYTLRTLSPLSELATHNVRRLNELLLARDNVSPYTTPVDDWLLAAVLHVTVSLQQITSSLYPIFHLIGLDSPLLSVTLMGVEQDAKCYESASKNDEEVFIKLESDMTYNNELRNKLDKLFATVNGVLLMRFSKECMNLLLTVMKTRRPLLEKAFEPRILDALLVFSDKIFDDQNPLSQTNPRQPPSPVTNARGHSYDHFMPINPAASNVTTVTNSSSNSVIIPPLSLMKSLFTMSEKGREKDRDDPIHMTSSRDSYPYPNLCSSGDQLASGSYSSRSRSSTDRSRQSSPNFRDAYYNDQYIDPDELFVKGFQGQEKERGSQGVFSRHSSSSTISRHIQIGRDPLSYLCLFIY